jgi:UDPglucose--hexose-1-phosphate uridylyltransferase
MNASFAPEYRRDVLTGLVSLIAPARSARPSARHPEPQIARTDDPFAEGSEAETPNESFAVRKPGTAPNTPGWNLRVVPNRYPAVLPVSASKPHEKHSNPVSDLFPSAPALGAHEVVIECPDSRSRLADLSHPEIVQVLFAWRQRVQQLTESSQYQSLAVFRNEGFSAGASLAHCHSQIIAAQNLTPLDQQRHQLAVEHRQSTGRELLMDLAAAERTDQHRIIAETQNFMVLCPFASRAPWHVRFIPLLAGPASFAIASDHCLSELAGLLKQTINALEVVLEGAFSFNLILPHPRLDQPPQYRWMLELLPRIGRHAGWEYLSNVEIVTVAPEYAAATLRTLIKAT